MLFAWPEVEKLGFWSSFLDILVVFLDSLGCTCMIQDNFLYDLLINADLAVRKSSA